MYTYIKSEGERIMVSDGSPPGLEVGSKGWRNRCKFLGGKENGAKVRI